MKEIPQNVSEAVKKRNPHLYGVRSVEASQPKPTVEKALVGDNAAPQGGASGVGVNIALIILSRRIMDSDNLQGSCKPLRDAIAKSIGIDDGDSRITWEYGQQKTEGRQGVIVKIEVRH